MITHWDVCTWVPWGPQGCFPGTAVLGTLRAGVTFNDLSSTIEIVQEELKADPVAVMGYIQSGLILMECTRAADGFSWRLVDPIAEQPVPWRVIPDRTQETSSAAFPVPAGPIAKEAS